MNYKFLKKRCLILLRRLFSFLVLFFLFFSANNQAIAQNLKKPFQVVRIPYLNQNQLQDLANRLDIWEVHHLPDYVIAMITPSEQAFLTTQGFSFTIDEEKTRALQNPLQALPDQVSGIGGYPCYRTVEETYQSLLNLETSYPKLAKREDIGDSWEKVQPDGAPGYDLWVLVLSNQEIPGPKPRFFLMAAVHAREYVTAETATRFAEHLLQNYGVDADITWLLDYFEVHILPQSNPDGRVIAEGEDPFWRKNTDNDDGCTDGNLWGVDLNRNSSYAWGGWGSSQFPCDEIYRGPSAASEPEIQAMENYVRRLFPDQRGPADNDPAPLDTSGLFITLHSYSELILWPWGHTSTPAPNHVQLQTLARKMAFHNYYSPQQSYNLYGTSGTNDEFAYGELGIAAYTYEMGTTFHQSCSDFETTIYPRNLNALLASFKATQLPYMAPAGPEVTQINLSSTSVQAGELVTVTVTIDDTRYSAVTGSEPTQNISGAQMTIDTPAWRMQVPPYYFFDPVDGAWDEKVEQAQVVINTAGMSPGRHTLFINASDAGSNWGFYSAVFLEITPGPPAVRDFPVFLPWVAITP